MPQKAESKSSSSSSDHEEQKLDGIQKVENTADGWTFKRTNPETDQLEYLAWFEKHDKMENGDCFEMRDTPEEIRLFPEEHRQTLWLKSVCDYTAFTIAEIKIPKEEF